jgi:hypothetical protein
MASSSSQRNLGSGLALAAATVALPVLVYVGLNGSNQTGNNQTGNNQTGNDQNGDNQNGDGHITVVPEPNAGWVLVPFFGAVLLFSSRQFFRANSAKDGR